MLNYAKVKRDKKMNFCSMSSQAIIKDKISVDNLFIHSFMPSAPENAVKVYLYGLYISQTPTSQDNSIESFAKHLGLSAIEIEDCFHYWKKEGLVNILDTNPIQVQYLPVQTVISSIKKSKLDKYNSFNLIVQDILKNRMITPTEYHIYYDLIERYNFEQEALIKIIKYCADLKGNNIGHAYISTVAINWANDNVITSEQVEARLEQYELIATTLGDLYKAMGIKRAPQIEEKDFYNKWIKQYNFADYNLVQIAKYLKNKKITLSFLNLDKMLEKYKNLELMTVNEIKAYEENQDILKDIAKTVVKTLGLYYENLAPVTEKYITPWTNMGYDLDGLENLASLCFDKGYRTLQSLDNMVKTMFKLGVISQESINQHLQELDGMDNEIKEVLNSIGLFRNVTNSDRTFFMVWKFDWETPTPVLMHASALAKNKTQPMVYLNKILATYFENQIDTIEKAKEFDKKQKSTNTTQTTQAGFKGRSYTAEKLNALFDNIDEIEV